MKSSLKYFFPAFLIIFAGLCFSQTAPKSPKAQPKPAAPASSPAPKQPEAKVDEDTVPPENPNALFPAVVARVNGKPILGRDLEKLVRGELANIGSPEWKNLREDYRGQLVYSGITTLVNSKLLYQKAAAAGSRATEAEVQSEVQKISKNFKSDAEMNIALANEFTDRAGLEKDIAEKFIIARYLDESINKKITVTPEEVTKYYSGHPKEFQHPDIVRTSQILIQPTGDTPEQDALAKTRAEGLLARVKKGEDFAKLAKENSMDASASQGGDIGFFSKDALAPEYGEAAFSLLIGGVKLVKSGYGYHIIKVTEKKPAGLSTLDEMRQPLTEFLKNKKGEEELTKLLNQLRDQAKVEILVPAGPPLKP